MASNGKYIRIGDFADADNVIEGRTFEDCWIYGPAVLYLQKHDEIGYAHFETNSIDQIFYVLQPNALVGGRSGVITVNETRFMRCHFVKVTFVGSQEQMDRFKNGENNKWSTPNDPQKK